MQEGNYIKDKQQNLRQQNRRFFPALFTLEHIHKV